MSSQIPQSSDPQAGAYHRSGLLCHRVLHFVLHVHHQQESKSTVTSATHLDEDPERAKNTISGTSYQQVP